MVFTTPFLAVLFLALSLMNFWSLSLVVQLDFMPIKRILFPTLSLFAMLFFGISLYMAALAGTGTASMVF